MSPRAAREVHVGHAFLAPGSDVMRESSETQVMRLAATQHGVLTTTQLAAAGIGRGGIAHRVSRGWLRRLHRGVYLAGPVESPLARPMAALLAVGPGAVLSHRTAGGLWNLLGAVPGPIEVTVGERGPRSREGIRVHTSATLPQSEIRRRHRLPLTSPERTLIDLAATLPGRELERVLEEAQVLRLLTARGLEAAIERHRARVGIGRLGTALEHGKT